jgi:hypothetical protein
MTSQFYRFDLEGNWSETSEEDALAYGGEDTVVEVKPVGDNRFLLECKSGHLSLEITQPLPRALAAMAAAAG